MHCLDDGAHYALAAGSRPATEAETAHLMACSLCRIRMLQCREWSLRWASGLGHSGDHAERQAGMVVLHPVAQMMDEREQARLCAQGLSHGNWQVTGRFTEASQAIVARLMRHRQNGLTMLHLLSDDPAKTQGIRVRLGDQGWAGYTDKRGYLQLPDGMEVVPDGIRLESPKAVFNLQNIYDSGAESAVQSFTVYSDAFDQLELELDKPGRYRLSFILANNGREAPEREFIAITNQRIIAGPMTGNAGVVEITRQEKILRVHLY